MRPPRTATKRARPPAPPYNAEGIARGFEALRVPHADSRQGLTQSALARAERPPRLACSPHRKSQPTTDRRRLIQVPNSIICADLQLIASRFFWPTIILEDFLRGAIGHRETGSNYKLKEFVSGG